jgi:sugar/nucleoside kinase (ribokinase family)
MDIHSLTLGKRENGKRYLRRPLNWKRYCACADYLQLNKEEFELLLGEKLSHDSMKRFFQQFEDGLLKALLITMGEQGLYLVYRPKSKLVVRSIMAPRIERLRDTTGCGDVFGAAFVSAIINGASIPTAARFANVQAARNCRFAGIEELILDAP